MYYLVAGLWATVNTASVISAKTAAAEAATDASIEKSPSMPQPSSNEGPGLQQRAFGRTIAQVCEQRGEKEKILRGETTSTERRFITLLDADTAEQLAHYLRQMVQSVRAEDGPYIYWAVLLSDLCKWNDSQRYVQRRWARAFYHYLHTPDGANDGAPDTAKEGE